MVQTQKNEFIMLIKSYNLFQLSAKILEGKTFDHREAVELGCIQQNKWTRNRENLNCIASSGIINISVYLKAYSAYIIKSCTQCSGKLSARGKL